MSVISLCTMPMLLEELPSGQNCCCHQLCPTPTPLTCSKAFTSPCSSATVVGRPTTAAGLQANLPADHTYQINFDTRIRGNRLDLGIVPFRDSSARDAAMTKQAGGVGPEPRPRGVLARLDSWKGCRAGRRNGRRLGGPGGTPPAWPGPGRRPMPRPPRPAAPRASRPAAAPGGRRRRAGRAAAGGRI